MNKQLKAQLEALTRSQLIALATQKEVVPYRVAVTETKESLVTLCLPIEGVLTPVVG